MRGPILREGYNASVNLPVIQLKPDIHNVQTRSINGLATKMLCLYIKKRPDSLVS